MHKIIKTTMDLMKIKSVSGNEKEIAKVIEYCSKYFGKKKVFFKEFKYKGASPVVMISNIDFHPHQSCKTSLRSGNPCLSPQGRGKTMFDIMCVGHLDVVPAKDVLFKPRIEGDKLYGRGSYDMKSGIALAMHDLEYVIDNKLDVAFAVLITTDEETTSNGIKNFVTSNPQICSRIVMDNDAGSFGTIIEKYKHSVGVKLRASGVSGHSSRPWQNVNAVTNLMAVILELQKIFPQYSKKQKAPKDTWIDTMEVTAFNSPVATNVTPEWAEALVNFRLTDKTSLSDLEKVLKKAARDYDTCYEVFMKSCGCYMDAKCDIIQKYKKIAEKFVGAKLKITHMNGATDARMFADQSTIIMHNFDGAHVHNDGEYVVISSVEKMAEIHKKFIDEVALKKL